MLGRLGLRRRGELRVGCTLGGSVSTSFGRASTAAPMTLDDYCKKEAARILNEERKEKEKTKASGSPDVTMTQETVGIKRAFESPPTAATTTSASSGSGDGPTRRVLKAQKSNEGEPVAKKLFEDEEIVTEKRHAAAKQKDWLICLEGMMESQTKTSKEAVVSQD